MAKFVLLVKSGSLLYIYCSLSCLYYVINFCFQSMFDATWKDRRGSFHVAPGTSMFIHWLVGMVYVFYFASFILLLREVLRPGVLWFLRNLNDPEFNPIQEVGYPTLRLQLFTASFSQLSNMFSIFLSQFLWPQQSKASHKYQFVPRLSVHPFVTLCFC